VGIKARTNASGLRFVVGCQRDSPPRPYNHTDVW